MRISDWSSDVCSSDIDGDRRREALISPPRIVHEQLDRQRKGRHRREGCRINQSRRENARVIALLVDCIASAKRQPQTVGRSEEHTSELQSLMRNSYAVFCLKQNKKHKNA